MTRLGEALRRTVSALIGRHGAAMVLRRGGVPGYDPATGDVIEAVQDVAVTGVIEEVETGHADGAVRRGDRIVTVAALDPRHASVPVDPAPGDELIVSGTVHRVVSVTATYAVDRPAAFRLHVRR